MSARKGADSTAVRYAAWGFPVLVAWIGLLLWSGSRFGLLDNNEGLYAATGWETLTGGHWVVPHVLGVPYLEKPPLLYWLLAASFTVFGKTEFAARLVPVAASVMQLAGILWFGYRIGRIRTAVRACVILATSLGFLLFSRAVMFDPLLAAFNTLALLCLLGAVSLEERNLLKWSAAWLALAVLAKGLVALVLMGLIVAAYVLTEPRARRGRLLRFLADPVAVLIFIIIAAPWHIAASIEQPGFAWFYFIGEHVLRFLGQREPRDYYSGSPFYYVPRLFLMLLPWILFVPLRRFSPKASYAETTRFFVLSLLLPFAFFSVSSAKANYYLVIVLPFAAWLIAAALERLQWEKLGDRVRLAAGAGLLVLGFVSVPILAGRSESGFAPAEIAMIVCAVAGLAAGTAHGLRRRRLGPPALAIAAAAVAGMVITDGWIAANDGKTSGRPIAEKIERLWPGTQLYLYRDFEKDSSLAFYLTGRLRIIDSASNDLFWARTHGYGTDVFLSIEGFSRRIGQAPVYVRRERLAEFSVAARRTGLVCAARLEFAGRAQVFVCGGANRG